MAEILIGLGFFGLFVACFVSATVIPLSSDVVLVALLILGLDYHICLVVASLGGWFGGMVNYYLGKLGKIEWIEKHSNIRKEKVDRMQTWLQGKGAYLAFLSWVPIVGNLIVVALGYMRSNVWTVSICLLIGVVLRYIAVTALTLAGIQVVQ